MTDLFRQKKNLFDKSFAKIQSAPADQDPAELWAQEGIADQLANLKDILGKTARKNEERD